MQDVALVVKGAIYIMCQVVLCRYKYAFAVKSRMANNVHFHTNNQTDPNMCAQYARNGKYLCIGIRKVEKCVKPIMF